MKENKFRITRDVSDDIADYFDAYYAAIELRDKAIKLPFGYKKAYRAAKDAVKNQREFWKRIYRVYPEIANHPFQYNRLEQTLTEKPEESL